MIDITLDELRIIKDLTIELTKLRQNECKHLAIENCSPQIFYGLLYVFFKFKNNE